MVRASQTDGNKPGAKEKGGKPKKALVEAEADPVAPNEGGIEKKKRRARPGRAALREIKKLQLGTKLLLQKAPFTRLTRNIIDDVHVPDPDGTPPRVTRLFFQILQAATEHVIKTDFHYAIRAAIHGKRITVGARDTKIVRYFRESGSNPFDSNMPTTPRLAPEETAAA